jgi:hypothetical protein
MRQLTEAGVHVVHVAGFVEDLELREAASMVWSERNDDRHLMPGLGVAHWSRLADVPRAAMEVDLGDLRDAAAVVSEDYPNPSMVEARGVAVELVHDRPRVVRAW